MPFLSVKPDEVQKVVLSWLMCALWSMGFAIGWSAVHTILVKRLGVTYLPYTYVALSLLGVLGSAVYLMVADRIARGRLLLFSASLTGVILLVARFFITNTQNEQPLGELIFFFILIFCANGLTNSTMGTQMWTIINDLFRPSQGQRIYPILGTAGSIGSIAGGLLVNFLITEFGVANLVIGWSLTSFGIAGLAVILQRKYGVWLTGSRQRGKVQDKSALARSWDDLREGWHFCWRYPLVQFLAIIAISFWAVGSIQDYQYTFVMNHTFTSEESLGRYYGVYTAVFNTTMIIFQLFLARYIIAKTGVAQGLLALPVTIVVTLGLLFVSQTFWPAILMRASWDLVGSTVQGNAFQLSYNAVPSQMRGRVRGFIDGMVNPLGGIIGGVLIIALNYLIATSSGFMSNGLLTVIGVILGSIWLLLVLRAGKSYRDSLVGNLQDSNRRTVMDAIDALGSLPGDEAVKHLLKFLEHEENALRLAALTALGANRSPEAWRHLLVQLQSEDEDIRAHAISVLRQSAASHRQPEAGSQIVRKVGELLLQDPSSRVRREAFAYILAENPPADLPAFVAEHLRNPDAAVRAKFLTTLAAMDLPATACVVAPLLQDPSPEVQSAAISVLCRSPEWRAQAFASLRKLLQPEKILEAERRQTRVLAGLRALAMVKGDKEKWLLVVVGDLLAEADERISALAAVCLLIYGQPSDSHWQEATAVLMAALGKAELAGFVDAEIMPLLPCLSDEGLDEVLLKLAMLPEGRREFITSIKKFSEVLNKTETSWQL